MAEKKSDKPNLRGQFVKRLPTPFGQCSHCSGKGKIGPKKCIACRGKGTLKPR